MLNEELKHNVKKAVKENVTVKVKPSSPEELEELLDKMTPEQIDQLKEKLAGLDKPSAEEPEDAGKPQDALEDEKDSGAADE